MPNDCVTVIKRLIYMLDLILLMESHRTERDWSTSTKDNISFTCQCQGVTSQTRCSRCHSLDSATASTLFFEDALVKRNPDVYTSSIFTPVIGNTLFSAIRSIKRRSTPFGYVKEMQWKLGEVIGLVLLRHVCLHSRAGVLQITWPFYDETHFQCIHEPARNYIYEGVSKL